MRTPIHDACSMKLELCDLLPSNYYYDKNQQISLERSSLRASCSTLHFSDEFIGDGGYHMASTKRMAP
jgi:hypothetical protein